MTRLALVLLLAAATPAVAAAQTVLPDTADAVMLPLARYLRGHATGSPEPMRLAFHPEARFWHLRDGVIAFRPIAEYIALFTGTPGADADRWSRRVVAVHRAGTMATAELRLDGPTAVITDHMTLLLGPDGWRIVGKASSVVRRP